MRVSLKGLSDELPNAPDWCLSDGSDFPTPLPSTIAGSASYHSGVIQGGGMERIAGSVHLSDAGTVQIKRYLDAAGQVPQTQVAAVTIAGGGGTALINVGADGLPFASWQVDIVETSTNPNTVTASAFLLRTN